MNHKINSKKRSVLLVILIISTICTIGIISLIFTKKETPNFKESVNNIELKYNQNESFTKEQIIGDLSFTNITCSYNGTTSYLSYTITNLTDKPYQLNEYNILILDQEGNTISTFDLNYNIELAPNEEFYTNHTINSNLIEAYSMKISLK